MRKLLSLVLALLALGALPHARAADKGETAGPPMNYRTISGLSQPTYKRTKGLVTAVISAGLSSMYDHQFQDGVPYDALWLGPIEAYYELTLVRALPPGFEVPDEMGKTGDDFGDNVQNAGCGAQSTPLA